MKNKLVGLHGLTQCGKDTLADELVAREGYVKLSLSDGLYSEIALAYGVTVDQLKSKEWKTTARPELALNKCMDADFRIVAGCALGVFKDEPLSSRLVLQTWGTEYRRKQHGDDYWTCQMIGKIRAAHGASIVIPDIREDHEAAMAYWLLRHCYFADMHILKVTRLGAASTLHSSDRGLSKFLIDGVVDNNGTVDELYNNATYALKNGREETRHE